MQDLSGKVAVVTGAGSGIGAAITRACTGAGMAVAVVDIDESRARETATAITDAGGRAEAYTVDVRDPDALVALADQVFGTFGACHLLCNNAGVCPLGSAWDHSFAEWQNTVAINVFGVVNGVNAFVPRMIAQAEEAHIVNTASAAALVYVPASALYNTTKAAVLSLTESLRGDLAPFGIGVSALCPGGVITNIGDTTAGTVGTPHSPAQLEEAFTQLARRRRRSARHRHRTRRRRRARPRGRARERALHHHASRFSGARHETRRTDRTRVHEATRAAPRVALRLWNSSHVRRHHERRHRHHAAVDRQGDARDPAGFVAGEERRGAATSHASPSAPSRFDAAANRRRNSVSGVSPRAE